MAFKDSSAIQSPVQQCCLYEKWTSYAILNCFNWIIIGFCTEKGSSIEYFFAYLKRPSLWRKGNILSRQSALTSWYSFTLTNQIIQMLKVLRGKCGRP